MFSRISHFFCQHFGYFANQTFHPILIAKRQASNLETKLTFSQNKA